MIANHFSFLAALLLLPGCGPAEYYFRKCFDLCATKGGDFISFARVEAKWECTCRVETQIEKIKFGDA